MESLIGIFSSTSWLPRIGERLGIDGTNLFATGLIFLKGKGMRACSPSRSEDPYGNLEFNSGFLVI